MANLNFVKNQKTGFYEYSAKVESQFDVHIELPKDADGVCRKHVSIGWKGAEGDTGYDYVTNATNKNGVYNEQFKSEFWPVWIKIECGGMPSESRLTAH